MPKIKTKQELTPLPDIVLRAEKLEDFDLGYDKRGSTHNAGEPRQTIQEELKHRFMRMIAIKLNYAFARKDFDQLILILPAHLLGEIRKYLDEDVKECVVVELPKELVLCEAKELLEHIKVALNSPRPQAA